MESFDQKIACPKCGSFCFKQWNELSDEEKIIAERLPASAEHPHEQRQNHYFCTRCWFEDPRHVPTIT